MKKIDIRTFAPNATRTVFMVMDSGNDTENACFATLDEARQYINLNPNFRGDKNIYIAERVLSYDADGDLDDDFGDDHLIAEHAAIGGTVC